MHLKIDSKPQLGSVPDIGLKFHIIGIGGIGMSAIAEVLHANGIFVQGSDAKENENVLRLKKIGIKCFIGHEEKNVEGVDVISYSSAVKNDNVEYIAGVKLNKVMMSRHQILREIILRSWNICVSGMHGKTTTTSMISLIFEYAKRDFIAIVGGIMQYNQSNSIVHANADWAVIEADESDDSFIKIPSTVAVITNISPEHLDYHLTFEAIKEKFTEFLKNIPYYGFGVICIDDDAVNQIISSVKNKQIYSYSTQNSEANFFAKNTNIIENNKISFDLYVEQKFLDTIIINIFGEFNINNCLAAIAVSYKLGIDIEVIKKSLFDFRSTKRRFEILGNFVGATVIDDYAHHPKEIAAVLKTAIELSDFRQTKLFIVFQPHRYSRLQKLYNSFIEVLSKHKPEGLIILPVYSAGEPEISNINSISLCDQINSSIFSEFDIHSLKNILLEKGISKNDVLLFMGAGDITTLAHEIAE
jgi:UDP-N-acetylmuramate--alanine ligase